MSIKIISLKDSPDLLAEVKSYCKENWGKVYDCFCDTAERSLSSGTLPQTLVLLTYQREKWHIIGFCQLDEHDRLTRHTDLTPFITTLFIDPSHRGGNGLGELLLDHARGVLGQMGYDTAYLCTDHIGYYEHYGFTEIGLDITDYGSPTKLYATDTITGIRYEIYDRRRPKPDHIRLAMYALRNPLPENTAWHLWMSKYCSITEPENAKWFTVTAFYEGRLVGAVNFMQNEQDRRNWYIGDLAVAEDLRRRGIASKMLRKGIERIMIYGNGGEFIYSYLEKDNAPSKALHRALGFTDTGEVRPFGDLIFGDDETTWVKML